MGEFKSSVFVAGSASSILIILLVLFLEPLSGNRWYSLRSMVIISVRFCETSRTVAIRFWVPYAFSRKFWSSMNFRGHSALFRAISASIFVCCVIVVLLFGFGLHLTISNSGVEFEGEADGRRLVGLVALAVRELKAISTMESYVSSGSGDMEVVLEVVEVPGVFFKLVVCIVSGAGSRITLWEPGVWCGILLGWGQCFAKCPFLQWKRVFVSVEM